MHSGCLYTLGGESRCILGTKLKSDPHHCHLISPLLEGEGCFKVDTLLANLSGSIKATLTLTLRVSLPYTQQSRLQPCWSTHILRKGWSLTQASIYFRKCARCQWLKFNVLNSQNPENQCGQWSNAKKEPVKVLTCSCSCDY